MASSRTVRVGLLVCGTLSGPVEATHGGYHEVYSYYWKTTTPHNCNAQVVIESFNIKKMKFPDEKRLDEFDIFMVTGSGRVFLQSKKNRRFTLCSYLSLRRYYPMG